MAPSVPAADQRSWPGRMWVRRSPQRHETGGTMSGAHPRKAIVTGADSGIGRATAQLLATEGFDVGITFHTDEGGARATAEDVERRSQRAFVARQDLASPSAADVVDELTGQLGGLGVLVNCGGTGISAPALDLDYDSWRSVVATDLDGPFLCAQRAARTMIEQRNGGGGLNRATRPNAHPRP